MQQEENDLVGRLLGRAQYLRDLGQVKTPQLLEEAANELRKNKTSA